VRWGGPEGLFAAASFSSWAGFYFVVSYKGSTTRQSLCYVAEAWCLQQSCLHAEEQWYALSVLLLQARAHQCSAVLLVRTAMAV
jgi:hypothetical protein